MGVRTGVYMGANGAMSSSVPTRAGVDMGAPGALSVYPRCRLGLYGPNLTGLPVRTEHPMQLIEVYQNTAITIPVFMRDATTDKGLAGLASVMVVNSKPAGSGFGVISPTITDRGNGWYDIALTAGMVATLGLMPLRITAIGTVGSPSGQENDEITLNVIALNKYDGVRAGLTALPNATAGANNGLPVQGGAIPNANASSAGGLLTFGTGAGQINVTGSGQVDANVQQWLGSAPAALTTNGYLQTMVLRWLTDNAAGTPAALDSAGNLPADIQKWLNAAPASLSTNGYVQAMLERWLTDDSAGTPLALSSNKVQASAGGGGGGGGGPTLKTQFVSTEDVQLVFLPFINKNTGNPYLGSDTVTLQIRRPDNTLLPSPPVPLFDSTIQLWTASIPHTSFMIGQWLIIATSNGAGTSPQNQVFTWGDYVDDIQESRQAMLGKWKIDPLTKRLYLYEDDGVTILKMFDLKDSAGNPSVANIFERDPV